jgi:hypothetical protein
MANYYDFDFAVEEMTGAQANELVDLILDYVEAHDLYMAGGPRATTDLDYPPFLGIIDRFTAWTIRIWKWAHNG